MILREPINYIKFLTTFLFFRKQPLISLCSGRTTYLYHLVLGYQKLYEGLLRVSPQWIYHQVLLSTQVEPREVR